MNRFLQMLEFGEKTVTAGLLALPVLLFLSYSSYCAEISSFQDGYWHAGATWVGGQVPGADDNVTISVGHTVTVAEASATYAVSNLTVNGGLTHTANNGEGDPHYRIDLTIYGDLTVNSGGAISGYGRGYAMSKGPAPGWSVNAGLQYGAAHGGMPTYTPGQPAYTNFTYGSITNPTTLGSGGNQQSGGGAVILRVTGQTQIASGGTIEVNGQTRTDIFYQSGGSGGSVNLMTGTLTGDGTIQAHGGGGAYYGGGGGRIAVKLTAGITFGNVVMTAYGGRLSSNTPGAAGTVYRQRSDEADGEGELIIDNNGYSNHGNVSTLISSNVTGTVIGSLVITNAGWFTVASNEVFTVTSNFYNYTQSLSFGTGGTFRVGGSGTTRLGGTAAVTRFYNFTCTNDGKRIEFASGKTYQLDGILNLKGGSGNEVELADSGSGAWKLNVPSPFAGSVNYVSVTNSDASSAATIAAYDSIDLGGNTNWSFASVGQTNTWTGSSSTSWGVAGNWDLGRLPVGTDVIRIWTNNSPVRWPVLSDHTAVPVLLLGQNAQLSLGTKNLTVSSNIVMTGTLIASGTETVTLLGAANLNGGVLVASSSTVVVGGAGAQALDFSGITFSTLTVTNISVPLAVSGSFSAATVSNIAADVTFEGALAASILTSIDGDLAFNDAVTATSFTCRAPGSTITFDAGSTVEVTNLILRGSVASPMILVSSASPSKWNLKVTGSSFVNNVTVSDSDASAGRVIRPVASTEGTPSSTVNWNFGTGTWKVWNGAGADFNDGANWDPAGALDSSSRVYIKNTNGITAPLLSTPAVVAELAVGGEGPALLTLQAMLTVTNRLVVLPQGVLTHTANSDTALYSIEAVVGGDLEIGPAGAVSADGKGFAGGTPGYGPAPGSTNTSPWYGACHGGMGAHDAVSVGSPFLTYGSVTNPVTLGSGGRGVEVPGGGAVILKVSGNTVITGSGRITATGLPDNNFWRSGGAGGSVNLTTATLAGEGLLQANGGLGTTVGGGGGRIAVKLTGGNSFGNVSMTAYGGGSQYGAAGTVYRQTALQGYGGGDLIIDNNGYTTSADVTTMISSNVSGAAVGSVSVVNRGRLMVHTNGVLSISGSLTNDANSTFSATNAGSSVAFVGTTPATVWGNRSYYNLSISDGRLKPLFFEAGRTQTVYGVLTMDKCSLQSTVEGNQWYLTLDVATGTQPSIKRVSVRDSNAGGGQTIEVISSGYNFGNNVNWYFEPSGTVLFIR